MRRNTMRIFRGWDVGMTLEDEIEFCELAKQNGYILFQSKVMAGLLVAISPEDVNHEINQSLKGELWIQIDVDKHVDSLNRWIKRISCGSIPSIEEYFHNFRDDYWANVIKDWMDRVADTDKLQ